MAQRKSTSTKVSKKQRIKEIIKKPREKFLNDSQK